MTDPGGPLTGLDHADRETAQKLLEAFAEITLDRPSPVTTPVQDADTSARLIAEFDRVVFEQDQPAVAPAGRARPRAWLAAPAVAACLVAVAAILVPSASSPAWAAIPRVPSAADRSAIDEACAAPLAVGPGDLQTQSRSVVGSVPPPVPAPEPLPETLPPLVSLDVRGDVAFAVYQDQTWAVSCVLRSAGGVWRDQGIQVGPASTTPGAIASTTNRLADGEAITTVSGAVPAGTTRVTFRLPDGTEVEASILGSTWAAWYPGDSGFDAASLVAYDGNGRAVSLT